MMRPVGVDKSRVCFAKRKDLSPEHFMELIGKRIQDCEAWEKKLRSQGNLKEAERIGKTKAQMIKSLGEIQICLLPRKK